LACNSRTVSFAETGEPGQGETTAAEEEDISPYSNIRSIMSIAYDTVYESVRGTWETRATAVSPLQDSHRY
jgi:hypothetical protein